jgi:hypothetical protein
MSPHRRLGVALLVASPLLLLAACKSSSAPDPSPSQPGVDVATKAPPGAKGEDAPPAAIDLEALSSDPTAALPGTLVRHGRYEVRQALHEGGFVVSMTEELAIHELGGRFVGRIASKSDETPMPPSFLVFVTDDQRRLEHVIWRGLKGTSAVAHEFSRASFRDDGPELEIVRHEAAALSSSIQRMKLSEAWTLAGTVALEYLPLWSEASVAEPLKAQWVSLRLEPDAERQPIRLEHRGKQTIEVGKHEVEASRYETLGKGPPVQIWVDEQGLVVRRLEPSEDDGAQTGWETIYVPLPGDPLAR